METKIVSRILRIDIFSLLLDHLVNERMESRHGVEKMLVSCFLPKSVVKITPANLFFGYETIR